MDTGFRIRIHLTRIQGFYDQKLKKIYSGKTTYPQASLKDVQVTKEAFRSQKKTSSTSKHEIYQFFLLLRVIFGVLDPDPDSEHGSGSTDLIEFGCNVEKVPECMRLDIDSDDGVGPELADGKLELLPGVHVQQLSRLHTGRPDRSTGTQINHKSIL
jgi:hypothetical protein